MICVLQLMCVGRVMNRTRKAICYIARFDGHDSILDREDVKKFGITESILRKPTRNIFKVPNLTMVSFTGFELK